MESTMRMPEQLHQTHHHTPRALRALESFDGAATHIHSSREIRPEESSVVQVHQQRPVSGSGSGSGSGSAVQLREQQQQQQLDSPALRAAICHAVYEEAKQGTLATFKQWGGGAKTLTWQQISKGLAAFNVQVSESTLAQMSRDAFGLHPESANAISHSFFVRFVAKCRGE